jgi:hypothetical protein
MVFCFSQTMKGQLMRTRTPVETLSRCMGHALNGGFSPVPFRRKLWPESRKAKTDIFEEEMRAPAPEEVEVIAMFPQIWDSSALGFDGIGASSMTSAYTVVLRHAGGEALVYFDGCFAYRIARPSPRLIEDIAAMALAPVGESEKYERTRRKEIET